MESLPLPKESLLPNMCMENPASGGFNYSSVVGMLLYLAGHTCPDITHAVNCAAKYMFCPKLVHEQALKQIGCFLKATADKGLIMKPSEKLLKIDSFPDANFVGMYGHEPIDDPVCVKSRTGYVIMVANCLIIGSQNCNLRPLYLQ